MQQTTIQRRTRSDELIDVLSDYRDVLIVAHDNPDPDAIATGWGVATLIEEKLGIRPRLVGAQDLGGRYRGPLQRLGR